MTAVVLAFVCGSSGAAFVVAAAEDRARESGVRGRAEVGASSVRALSSGVPGVCRVAPVLLRAPKAALVCDEACLALRGSGVVCARDGVCSTVAAALAVLMFVVWAFSGLFACAVVCAAVLVATTSWATSRRGRRVRSVAEEVPDALRTMQSCFRAGLSLQQTLGKLSEGSPGWLSARFRAASDGMATGQSVDDALLRLREGGMPSELSFVAAVLAVQHRTGGGMGEVLDAAREGAAAEAELKRTLRVQTAQARASYHVVLLVTFSLVAVLSLLDSSFLDPFLSSPAGVVMLMGAVGMMVGGIVWVKRLLSVEGV